MNLVVAILLGGFAGLLFIPALVLAIECLFAVWRPSVGRRKDVGSGAELSMAIVIPAHNEELSIERTVAALLPELAARDRIVVVADNCGDATAAMAARLGVTVLERHDPERRGKGYALDHALQHLRQLPPDVVLFLDADCVLSPGGAAKLVQVAHAAARPAQAHYHMLQEGQACHAGRRIAAFAWLVRGLVRPTGLAAMGMPCQLYGTGMAIPWSVLERLSLASGDIVEDMKLTVDLIEAGAMPIFCADVTVSSTFPTADAAAAAQRKRWEHGHIATILKYGLPALWRGLVRADTKRLALALDVCVPPLSLLLLLLVLVSAMAVVSVVLLGEGLFALAVLGASWGMVLIGLALAWFRFGRDIIDLRTLLNIPGYVLGKVSLYLKYFTNRQQEWNRADRD
jgi:cellulose synthase/poly-beta-1,6-N-acetylglucosamine synthase-like glycosyltransferase